jgi:hypothetical protein
MVWVPLAARLNRQFHKISLVAGREGEIGEKGTLAA